MLRSRKSHESGYPAMLDEKRTYRELAEFADEISRCGRCGFCQGVCPVYQVSANEGGAARGRNMYARELIGGGLELSRQNESFLSECLLCRACVDMCFSAVKTDDIVLAGRRARRRIHGTSPIRNYLFERVLPDHRKLGRFLRMAVVGKDAGLGKLAHALSVFGWFGRGLSRTERFLETIPRIPLRERLAGREISRERQGRATFFIGCGINFMFPEVGEASVAILETLNYSVKIVEHGCCGLPPFVQGELEAARSMARKNMERLSHDRDSLIVTDCSSCASFLKDYPKLFSIGNAEPGTDRAEAETFASRVRDLTEMLAEEECVRSMREKRGSRSGHRQVISFHDPCHLSRHQGLSGLARDVLRSLPDFDFVEMREADWCCGGAGAFAVEHADLSLGILERKMRNIESSGADTLATSCPSCLMQIRTGLLDAGSAIRTKHLVEIVRECLPQEDMSASARRRSW